MSRQLTCVFQFKNTLPVKMGGHFEVLSICFPFIDIVCPLVYVPWLWSPLRQFLCELFVSVADTISTTDHRPTSRWSALLCLSRHLVLFKALSLDGGGGGGGRRVMYSGQREQSFSSPVWCWGSGVLSSQNPASVLRGFKTKKQIMEDEVKNRGTRMGKKIGGTGSSWDRLNRVQNRLVI